MFNTTEGCCPSIKIILEIKISSSSIGRILTLNVVHVLGADQEDTGKNEKTIKEENG